MKRSFAILLFLLISICSASAQDANWIPLGEGLPERALDAVVMDGNLYVLHNLDNTGIYTHRISKWDGASWTTVTDCGTLVYTAFLEVYKGEIYMGGYFEDVNGIPGTRGIAKWDGTSWQSVGGGFDAGRSGEQITEMIEYRGDLYCTGEFLSIGGIRVNHIARWDGTRWHPLEDGLAPGPNYTQWGFDLAVYKGDLYVGHLNNNLHTLDIPGRTSAIRRWDGTSWSAAGDRKAQAVRQMTVYRDELYGIGVFGEDMEGTQTIERWDGSAWNVVPIPQDLSYISFWEIYDGKMYGRGWEGRDPIMLSFDGTQWERIPGFDNNIDFLTLYNGELHAGGRFTKWEVQPLNYIARLCDATNCGTISGTVYHDLDGDCAIGSSDPGLMRRIVEVTPGPYYITSKSDGSYAQYVPPGTYDVKLAPRDHWNQTCPVAATGYNVTLATGDNAKENDFALQPVANVRDVRVSIIAGRARPGMDLTYAITYENVGTVPVDGTVRFQHDPRLTFASSTPAQTRSAGKIIEWDFTNLAVDEVRTINVTMTASQTMSIGMEICGSVDVEINQIDLRIHHRDTFCIDVTGSYDPNDISVTPFGIEENGEISPEDSILTYIVRFQNTGNDTAFKVVVVDTLSAHLDVTTFTPGAASHPFSFSISGKGVVTWTFDNILLPDSNASEPNSHGFFKYIIRQRKDLASGTRIPNRVDIYFDYNAPVATNTVVSIIMGPSSVPLPVDPVDVTVYPNPAKGMIHLRGMLADDARIELRDLLGNRIEAAMERVGDEAVLDLNGVPSGTYFVAIATKDGTVLRHITVAR